VAVDAVLKCLISLDFHGFVRVGSLKRIDKSILKYTVQSRKDVRKDVEELLQLIVDEKLTGEDRALIHKTISRFEQQDAKKLLTQAHIVGKSLYNLRGV
jgi:hypothetical protein